MTTRKDKILSKYLKNYYLDILPKMCGYIKLNLKYIINLNAIALMSFCITIKINDIAFTLANMLRFRYDQRYRIKNVFFFIDSTGNFS